MLISACLVFIHLKKNEKPWIISFIIVAIIYNPILSIHLTRQIWTVINLLTIILTVLSIFIYNDIFSSKAKE